MSSPRGDSGSKREVLILRADGELVQTAVQTDDLVLPDPASDEPLFNDPPPLLKPKPPPLPASGPRLPVMPPPPPRPSTLPPMPALAEAPRAPRPPPPPPVEAARPRTAPPPPPPAEVEPAPAAPRRQPGLLARPIKERSRRSEGGDLVSAAGPLHPKAQMLLEQAVNDFREGNRSAAENALKLARSYAPTDGRILQAMERLQRGEPPV